MLKTPSQPYLRQPICDVKPWELKTERIKIQMSVARRRFPYLNDEKEKHVLENIHFDNLVNFH